MAVYTDLSDAALAELTSAYDIGVPVCATGIADGISNSNWVLETATRDGGAARFILTLYERRIDPDELPFFLALLDHLAARGCAVPATIHDRKGRSIQTVAGKSAALIEFLPGRWPTTPSPAQAHAAGVALAHVHLAAQDFPLTRRDRLDPATNLNTLMRCAAQHSAAIDPRLADATTWGARLVDAWPTSLPRSIIHSDLFPDNVLMIGERVSGLIDFYFACDGMMAYDLAVTHAAWCFDQRGERFDPDLGTSLLAGYSSVRALEPEERAALPILAEGACLRFTASRAEDWLDTPADGRTMRKDPMDFVRRWEFYRASGAAVFANA